MPGGGSSSSPSLSSKLYPALGGKGTVVFPPEPSPKNAAAPGRREEERVVSCLFVIEYVGLSVCHNLLI